MSARDPFGSPSSGEVELDPLHLSDLTELSSGVSLSADEVVPVLRARFNDGLIYTQLSPSVLISVNPNHFVQSGSDAVLEDYLVEFDDCGSLGVRGRLGPHLWSISNRAYYYMTRTGQDQTVLFS